MDTLTKEERSEVMSRVRSSDTAPERVLRRLVWSMGYRYRKNKRDVFGVPDIAMVGRKRALFLHGCFWHRHDCPSGKRTPKSRTMFWTAKFSRNVQRDQIVQATLNDRGWKSLVVWECDLCNEVALRDRIR